MIPLDEYDITAAFQAIENELIASMIRNMDRHRAEETKEGIEWSMWQAEQLKALEKYKRDNQKKYKKQFKNINGQIEALIRQARDTGNMQQEMQILNAIKNGFKGAQKIAPGVAAEFFRLNDRKLDALIDATVHDMEAAEIAILRKANDDYRKAIYNAQVYANTGAGTYEKAVDMATKDMLSRGLNCVVYANGARHTLADYADMAIRTASKRAYLQGEGEKRQEWGISTVIVNKRGNPCPKCLPFVGKVLIDDVWSGGSKDGVDPESGKMYPLISYAISKGLYHPRCKDSHTTYFPGVSTADDTWTEEELEAVGLVNKRESERQYAKRQAEKYERLAEYSLDDENQRRYASRREEWKKRHASLGPSALSEDVKKISTEERRKQWFARHKVSENNARLDFNAMTKDQLEEWANHNLKTKFEGIQGANTEFVAEAVKVMAEFEEKMGGKTIEGLSVKFGGAPKGVYAKFDDKTNTILLKKTGSKAAFEQSQRDENIRFRYKWRTDKDYHATETFSGTVWHELAHAVDIDSGESLSKALSLNQAMDELSVKVSAYAGNTQNIRVSKRSEAWAENFAAYMDGGKNKNRVPAGIKDMIEKYFRDSSY